MDTKFKYADKLQDSAPSVMATAIAAAKRIGLENLNVRVGHKAFGELVEYVPLSTGEDDHQKGADVYEARKRVMHLLRAKAIVRRNHAGGIVASAFLSPDGLWTIKNAQGETHEFDSTHFQEFLMQMEELAEIKRWLME